MIEITGVKKSFGDLEVLRGIDLTVNKGEVISVIGASGSGKSTMLYCINALEPIDSGQIVVDGVDVHSRQTDVNRLRPNEVFTLKAGAKVKLAAWIGGPTIPGPVSYTHLRAHET